MPNEVVVTEYKWLEEEKKYYLVIVINYEEVRHETITPLEFYEQFGEAGLKNLYVYLLQLFLTDELLIEKLTKDKLLDGLLQWSQKQLKKLEQPQSKNEFVLTDDTIVAVEQRCKKMFPCKHEITFFKNEKVKKQTLSGPRFYEKYGIEGLKKLSASALQHWLEEPYFVNILRKDNILDFIEAKIASEITIGITL